MPPSLPVATLMAAVRQQRPDLFLDALVFTIRTETGSAQALSQFADVSPSGSSVGQDTSADLPDIRSLRESKRKDPVPEVFNVLPLPSTIEVFSRTGGLGLLAKHLPIVYPETLRQIAVGSKITSSVGVVTHIDKESPVAMSDADWVKIENADDFYDVSADFLIRQLCVVPDGRF